MAPWGSTLGRVGVRNIWRLRFPVQSLYITNTHEKSLFLDTGKDRRLGVGGSCAIAQGCGSVLLTRVARSALQVVFLGTGKWPENKA